MYRLALTGNYQSFLNHLLRDITSGSISATYEDGSDITLGDVQMAVRVYERYSMMDETASA